MSSVRRVFVAGAASAARHAIVRRLMAGGLGADQIDTWDDDGTSLSDQAKVRAHLRLSPPDQIYIACGPWSDLPDAEERRGTYLADALLGPVQLIREAMYAGVRKLLFVASHQVYGQCPVLPVAEEDLAFAAGSSRQTPLGVAHLAGIRLCEALTHEFGEALGLDYRSVVVGNVYGTGDVASPAGIYGLLRHIHQASAFKLSAVSLRGFAGQRTDWLCADDMADACVNIMNLPARRHALLVDDNRSHVNLGSGEPTTLLELAQAIAKVTGYEGQLLVDPAVGGEDDAFFLDTHRLRSTGWRARIGLESGLAQMYRDYQHLESRMTRAS
jgi:GDP-L-fucose synthase